MAPQVSLYLAGDRFLYRLNPVTKLVVVGCVIMLTFLAPGSWTPWLMFTLLGLLALSNNLARPFFRSLWRIIAPLALFLFVIHGLFSPDGQTILLTVGPLALKQEGLAFAWLMTGRILSVTGVSLLLVFTTPPAALMLALAQHGVPTALTYIMGTTLQIIPQMRARAAAIIAAQQARGLETTGSLPQRVRALRPLITPLVLSSLVDVEERAIALEARAFRANRPKTSLTDLPDPPGERLLRWLGFGLTLLIIGAGWQL